MYINHIVKNINNKYFKRSYDKSLKLFDVSLRDGLQSINKIYTFNEKKVLLHEIIKNFNPESIEVGSIVSNKVLPQMNNSIELYKYALSLNNDINYYLLIPNKNKLKIALKNNVKNMSFITSFSDSFQLKNIKKSLKDTKNELLHINDELLKNNLINNKLYLSCFNHCPIANYIDDDSIYNEILFYDKLKSFDEYCLSDTTGKLKNEDFERLIYNIKKIVNVNKLSLHLHVNKNDIQNTIDIIKMAFKLDINKLDISCLEDGGCSVTIDKKELNSNFSYAMLDKLT